MLKASRNYRFFNHCFLKCLLFFVVVYVFMWHRTNVMDYIFESGGLALFPRSASFMIIFLIILMSALVFSLEFAVEFWYVLSSPISLKN